MALLLDVLLNKLTADGVVGGASGFQGYVAYAPDTQPQIVSLFEAGGLPEETQEKSYAYGTVQARVRAAELDYPKARNAWQAVYDSLQNADLSANGVLSILADNSVPLFFMDAKNRPNLTCNFKVRWKL